ncbi:MAG: hypothetical protein K2N67_07505 [Mucispirillum sp.]|nr:hypothetical protein [Mucispirillum sp.]
MNKEIKTILKKYKNMGFIFKNGSKHIIARHRFTGKKVTIAKTPSDIRAIMNIRKRLENAMI